MSSRAIAQSESQPPSNPLSQSAGAQSDAAAQMALAIAGAASMTAAAPAGPPPAQPLAAGPTHPAASEHAVTPEQRRQFMMLLILHETSRNPVGSLH
jgi:hypothetical protein